MKKLFVAGLFMVMSSTAFSAELTQTCKNYYAEIDKFVQQLAANEETKALADEIMENYPIAKNKHMSLPKEAQDRSCSKEAAELQEYQQMMAAEG